MYSSSTFSFSVLLLVFFILIIILLFSSSTSSIIDAAGYISELRGKFTLPPSAPTGRENFGMTCAEGSITNVKLWIVGGVDNTGVRKDQYYFDLATNTWSASSADGMNSNIINFHLMAINVNGADQLLAFCGRDYTTNDPSSVVQAYSDYWRTIDASNPSNYLARDTTGYHFGAWSPRINQLGTGMVGAFLNGGISTNGFSPNTRLIAFNRTEGVLTAQWEMSVVKNPGTAGVDHPEPLYGHCCARDPGDAVGVTVAYCFGGQNYQHDVNDVWKIDYSGMNSPIWEKLTTMSGDIPSRRRFAACSFVAPGKFLVFGGFDVDRGTPVADKMSYVLEVGSKVWTRYTNAPAVQAVSNAKMTTCFFANNDTYKTFLFGGALSNNNEYSNILITWDAANNKLIPQQIGMQNYNQPTTRPTARTFHNSFTRLGDFYILNGRDKSGNDFNDLWEYSTTSRVWKKLSFPTKWSTRHGAAVVPLGSLLLMYGGYSSWSQTALGEIVKIDTEDRGVVITTDVDAAAPFGRYFHVAFALLGSVALIHGGKDSSENVVGTFHAYSTISNSWKRVYPNGDASTDTNSTWQEKLKRYGHSALSYNSTHGIVGLGFGTGSQGTFNDFWWVFGLDERAGSIKLQQFNMTNADSQPRDYVRAFAATALIGNLILVCGGQSSEKISPPHKAICFTVSVMTYTWAPVVNNAGGGDISDWILSASVVQPIADQLYFFGGQRSNGIAMTDELTDQVLTYQFQNSSVCKLGETEGCLACSPGFVAPNCEPAPAGHYSSDPSKLPTKCPVGTYQNQTGVADSSQCYPCPSNTYNDVNGSANCTACPTGFFCPVGADEAIPSSSLRAQMFSRAQSPSGMTGSESHPPAYASPTIPYFWIGIVCGIMLLIILILSFLVCMAWKAKRNRLSHYLNDSAHKLLETLYNDHAKSRRGMSEEDFMTCLVVEKGQLPDNTIDVDIAHKIFNHVDRYRGGYFVESSFKDSICIAIEFGYMTPFPETPAVNGRRMPPAISKKLGKVQLEDLDIFEDQHQNAVPGESNRFERTSFGGLVTLAAVVLIVGMVLMVIFDFLLSSVNETKSLVPFAVIYESFSEANGVRGGMRVSTNIVATVTWWGLLRTGVGVNSLQEACVDSTKPGNCATATVVPNNKFYGTLDGLPHINSTTTCSYDAQQESCTVEWNCLDCGLTSDANLTFTVSAAIAAPVIRTRFSTGSGIHQPTTNFLGTVNMVGGPLLFSTIESFATPPSSSTVFSGFPATTWSFDLSPTYFESEDYPVLLGQDATYREKGYHIYQPSAATPGNAIAPNMFSRYYDAPVVLKFDIASTPVHCSRVFIRTVIDLMTSLLGGASGLLGGIVVVLQFFDARGENKNFEKEEELKDKDDGVDGNNNNKKNINNNKNNSKNNNIEPFGNNNNSSSGVVPPTPKRRFEHQKPQTTGADFEKLQLLMSSGLSLKQAEAVCHVSTVGNNNSFISSVPEKSIHDNDIIDKMNNNNNINIDNNTSKKNNYLKNLPPPSDAQLNAPDYVLDQSVNSTGMFYSELAGLFWHEESNMFFDPSKELWWDQNERCWKPAAM